MKSLAVSVFWPVWEWIRWPSRRWLFSSYAASLSIRDSLKCRRLIESPWFRQRWGDRFILRGDQNAKVRFDNDKTGYRIATSVGGLGTGEGGDRVVVDDPHNVLERESDLIRESTLIWWNETMSTRGNDPKLFAKVVVMQRVHEKDLSGHVLAQGGYEHLCLPAEYESHRRCVTVLGWEDPRRVDGELLWPERIGPKEIADFKLRLGANGYAGQFQQVPAPTGGGRFKSCWFRCYATEGDCYRLTRGKGEHATSWLVRDEDCQRFATMDPAGTDPAQNAKACYTVMQAWAIAPSGDMLLLDQYREQVETPDAADAAVEFCRKWDVDYVAIEKDGLGLGVVQTVKRRGVTVQPIKARGSKEARSETAEIRMAAGMIHFPAGAAFLFELEKELLLFPNGQYADQTDCLAHAARIVQKQHGPPRGAGDESWDASKTAEAEEQSTAPGHPGDAIPRSDPNTPPTVATDSDEQWIAGN